MRRDQQTDERVNRLESELRQRDAQLRRIQQRQVSIPWVGEVDGTGLGVGLILGIAGLALLRSGGDGMTLSGSTDDSGDSTPNPGDFTDRESFMSACLSETGGDMSRCATMWKDR